MDEKEKKITVSLCLFMFLAIIFAQSIIDNNSLRRADIEIDDLKRQLVDAGNRIKESSRELEDSRRTIEQCNNSVGRIADNIGEQSTELQSIIANLRTVREEIENMENALDFFYYKYGYNDNDYNNNGGELE